jgi:hypothetical protein
MSKFTSALSIKEYLDLHVTLCFCTPVKSKKIMTSNEEKKGLIVDVQYWSEINITVAIIESDFVVERHQYYKDNGYDYEGFDFKPHATLGKGDLRKENIELVGKKITLCDEYIRIY